MDKMRCVDEAAVTPELDAAIRELLCTCFPDDAWNFRVTRTWHGSGPDYSIVYAEDGRVLGHVGIHVREVDCDGTRLRVAGVQNVAVHPERRGSGLAHRVMRASMEEAVRQGIPYGLLFCVPELERFYSRLGWVTVEPEVTMVYEGVEQPIPGKNIAMVHDLESAPLRPGVVHLLGADW